MKVVSSLSPTRNDDFSQPRPLVDRTAGKGIPHFLLLFLVSLSLFLFLLCTRQVPLSIQYCYYIVYKDALPFTAAFTSAFFPSLLAPCGRQQEASGLAVAGLCCCCCCAPTHNTKRGPWLAKQTC